MPSFTATSTSTHNPSTQKTLPLLTIEEAQLIGVGVLGSVCWRGGLIVCVHGYSDPDKTHAVLRCVVVSGASVLEA
jgi:hypothetical protein